MQIVIDIPDNHNFKEDVKIAYELIRHREDIPLGTIGFLNMLYQRIDKIISLPKGHGRLGDLDKLNAEMYHNAFETDTDLQKWDSGCWIRYKLFENVIDDAPAIIEKE